MGSVGIVKPHAVFVPFPAQGHANPVMHLAKLLHSRSFFITFVNTEFNHRRFIRSYGANSVEGLPDFRFETIPDGLPLSDRDATQNLSGLCESIRNNCLAPILELQKYLEYQKFSFELPQLVVSWDIFNSVNWLNKAFFHSKVNFPSFVRANNPKDILLDYFGSEAQNCLKASAIIFNTFEEFEVLKAIAEKHLKEFAWRLANCKHPFLWIVRPDIVMGESGILEKELEEEIEDRGENIEVLVKEIMEGGEGKEMKEKALEWKKKAEAATDVGGLSYSDFDRFVKEALKHA
ncbi:hypothetical protein F3Y22_tig00110387pilonHSYRG00411 [Hibiscus syriacus]|uniref:Glycosyltransferase N-terminal domain-containing protein n=1 Tax=Hibiscus syriacus TaxID=106335 RepID=A0A6A3AQS9_HIBSY|nr:hypothetical protein F3Y22_tig00110387pilonHSYRG00411 [Hibiscus syriacus]